MQTTSDYDRQDLDARSDALNERIATIEDRIGTMRLAAQRSLRQRPPPAQESPR